MGRHVGSAGERGALWSGARRVLWRAATLAIWTSRLAGQQDTTRASTRLIPVAVAGQFGYIDSTGRMIIAPRFQNAEAFSEGLARACLRYRCGFIDTTGAMVIEARFGQFGDSRFSEGLANVAVESDKWGYIDRTGRIVIAPQFFYAGVFSEGRAKVNPGVVLQGRRIRGDDGYIDRTGQLVIEPGFYHAGEFSEGLAAVLSTEDEGGFIDTTGTMVIEVRPSARASSGRASFEWMIAASFSEGRGAVPDGDQWGYVDRTGRMAIPARFEQARRFAEGLAAVRLNGKWGYVDTTGTTVIEARFDDAATFSEGLARIGLGRRMRSPTDRVGLMTLGYIDKTGRIVIEPQFMEASDFSGGLACVHMQRRIGLGPGCFGREGTYIDRTGRHVWEPQVAPILALRPPEPADTTPLEGTGSIVDRVATLVDLAEAAEAGTPINPSPDQLRRNVMKAAAQLAAYLETHRDDSRALILSARLGRLLIVSQPLVWQQGQEVPTVTTFVQEYAPHHAALDRALALEPDNAEAHYWKGRLYGLSFNWKQMLYGFNEPPDSEVPLVRAYGVSAVRFGQRAVELAPARVDYREALAVYYALNEQEDEAITLLRDIAGGRHPIYLLLTDWKALPLPAGALLMRGESRSFGQMAREGGGSQDYPFLRVRVYLLPMPMDSVQAFYQARWPGFRFHKMESEESDGTRMRSYVQYVRWRNGQVIAARNKGQIPDQPSEGVAVGLVEFTNPPVEARERFPIPVGNVISLLTFVNARRSDSR